MNRNERPAFPGFVAAALTGPAAVAAVVILVAILVNLGPLHRLQDADSLMPVLVSLYQWQPFFWEQDRYGMLIPLLAIGIHHPFYNLIVQNALTSIAALVGFFALARIATERLWIVAGSAAATLFLLTGSEPWRFNLLTTFGPFAHGLGITAAGAAVIIAGERLGRRRLLLGTLLLVLGEWVYTAAAFLLIPALVLRGWLARADRPLATRSLICAALTAGALLLSVTFSATAPVRMKYATLPVLEWLGCWIGLVENAGGEGLLGPRQVAMLSILFVAGVVTLAVRRGRSAPEYGAWLPLVAGALVLVGMMGTINWTQSQGLAGRYSLGSVVALDVAAVAFAAAALIGGVSESARRRVSMAALASLLAAALVLYHPSSPSQARRDLDPAAGARTAEVIDAGITHVAGSYWTVWPTVYHANLVLFERGSRRRIWGIAHRASPTADRWARIPLADWRVAAIPEEFQDPWTAEVLRAYHIPPLRPIARLRTFTVMVPDTTSRR